MPFPLHPRPGSVHPAADDCPSSGFNHASSSSSSPPSPPARCSSSAGRQFVLFVLSCSLALALVLILALQLFRTDPDPDLSSSSEMFSEIRISATDGGEQFSVFGRRLMIGDGDFFLEIPYAQPTGRFQPAKVAALPRNYYAIHYGNGCPSGFVHTKPGPGINWNPPPLEVVPVYEQCQTLNIFRCPNTKNAQQLVPVLVYVPEGHWLKRSNANLEPTTTIRELACAGDGGGMLVVSINYRMGPYGMFRAPHWPAAQADLSLSDIRTALQWVQQHIAHFGGHRAHVTVMARGEGARMVSLLGMLPDSQNLFKRQILLSGSGFVPVLLQPDDSDHLLDASMQFAIAADCVTEMEWKMAERSKNKTETELDQEERKAREKLDNCMHTIGQETISAAESRRAPPSPLIRWPLRSSSALPIPENRYAAAIPSIATMIGICTDPEEGAAIGQRQPEGALEGASYRKRLEEALRAEVAERMTEEMKGDLGRMGEGGAELIRDHYLGEIAGPAGEPEELIRKIAFDLTVAGPALLECFARARLGSARVFGALFRAPASGNLSAVDCAEYGGSDSPNVWAGSRSACLDDLLFNPPYPGQTDEERRTVQRFAEAVTNFVTYGEPNPEERPEEWPVAYSRVLGKEKEHEESARWMDLNNGTVFDALELLFGSRENATRFWLCAIPKRMGINIAPGGDECP